VCNELVIGLVALSFIVMVLVSLILKYHKQISDWHKEYFYNNYDFIKPIFQSVVYFSTTLLALNPILSKHVIVYILTSVLLYYFSAITSFGKKYMRIDLSRKQVIILVISGITSIVIACINFNSGHS